MLELSQAAWEGPWGEQDSRHGLIKERAAFEERVKTLEAELQAARMGNDEMGSAVVAELRDSLMQTEESLRQEREMAKMEKYARKFGWWAGM